MKETIIKEVKIQIREEIEEEVREDIKKKDATKHCPDLKRLIEISKEQEEAMAKMMELRKELEEKSTALVEDICTCEEEWGPDTQWLRPAPLEKRGKTTLIYKTIE